MRRAILFASILFATPAFASDDVSVALHYEAFSHSLPVMRMDAALHMAPGGYGIRVTYHTVGLAGLFYHGQENDSVSGRWDGTGLAPIQYLAQGSWRGHQRETEVGYHKLVPSVTVAQPPVAEERQPVPPDLLPGTIDTLSAFVDLIRHVQTTGSCDMSVRTFDGRRLSEIQAQSDGTETLDHTDQSIFAGPALRCSFDGRMLAGFMLDRPANEPVRPYHGSAWLARIIPGGPPLPVRLSFQTKWVGVVTMYLVGISTVPSPSVQANAAPVR